MTEPDPIEESKDAEREVVRDIDRLMWAGVFFVAVMIAAAFHLR